MIPKLRWRLVPMTEKHGEMICSWAYSPPYHIYNWPSWAHMLINEYEFADPIVRSDQYAAVVDDHDQLFAFAQFFPLLDVTRLGLGLRPDLVGQGLGSELITLLVQEARQRDPQHIIDLEVLTWNIRAQKTYRKAGFTLTDSYIRMTPNGFATFYCMVYDDGINEI